MTTASGQTRRVLQIAPSILSADVCRLGEQVHEALDAGVRWIHRRERASPVPRRASRARTVGDLREARLDVMTDQPGGLHEGLEDDAERLAVARRVIPDTWRR